MELSTEMIRDAMKRDGSFPNEYHGGELYREETYSPWFRLLFTPSHPPKSLAPSLTSETEPCFRFKPGDWLVADVKSSQLRDAEPNLPWYRIQIGSDTPEEEPKVRSTHDDLYDFKVAVPYSEKAAKKAFQRANSFKATDIDEVSRRLDVTSPLHLTSSLLKEPSSKRAKISTDGQNVVRHAPTIIFITN